MTDPIRVFIGSAVAFSAAEAAIVNSITRHASVPVDVTFMRPETLGVPPTGCTGFTNLRYAVPELAGFSGFAIYLDVDMIVLGDIAELYSHAEAGKWVVMQDGSTEVAVISCGTHRHLPALRDMHKYRKGQLDGMIRKKPAIPHCWNVEDRIEPGAKLLHFTDLKCQPWMDAPEYPHPCPEAVEVYRAFA